MSYRALITIRAWEFVEGGRNVAMTTTELFFTSNEARQAAIRAIRAAHDGNYCETTVATYEDPIQS